MRKYLFIWILVLSSIQATFAQNNVLQVTGIVKDEANEPLIGVNIIIKDNPGLGAHSFPGSRSHRKSSSVSLCHKRPGPSSGPASSRLPLRRCRTGGRW